MIVTPLHASDPVAVPVAEGLVLSWQFTVTSATSVITGAVLSMIVNVAVVTEALPQSSVAVKVHLLLKW